MMHVEQLQNIYGLRTKEDVLGEIKNNDVLIKELKLSSVYLALIQKANNSS